MPARVIPSYHRACCYLSASISAASYRSSVVGEVSATAKASDVIRHDSPSTIRFDKSMAECYRVRQTNKQSTKHSNTSNAEKKRSDLYVCIILV